MSTARLLIALALVAPMPHSWAQDGLVEQARGALAAGETERALLLSEDIMRRSPADEGARRFRSAALCQRAIELGAERRWIACFDLLDQAQRLSPLDARLARNRHLLLLSAALASAEAGDADGALGWLAQLPDDLEGDVAARLPNAQAEVHWRLAQARRPGGDSANARDHLERALTLAPQREEIRDALIQRLYSDLQWDEAQAAISEALSRDPGREDLRRLSLKISRDQEALQAHGRITTPHFNIIHPEGAGTQARRFGALLEREHGRLSEVFGMAPTGRIDVLIYSLDGFRDVMIAPHWAQAGYDGRLRFFLMDSSTEEAVANLEDSLSHELSHAFIEEMAGPDCPLWLREGLASALEANRRVGGSDRERAAEILERRGLSGAHDAFSGIDGSEPTERAQDAYHVAMCFAHWLLTSQPQSDLQGALREVGEGSSPDSAFQSQLGKTLDELDQEWRASL